MGFSELDFVASQVLTNRPEIRNFSSLGIQKKLHKVLQERAPALLKFAESEVLEDSAVFERLLQSAYGYEVKPFSIDDAVSLLLEKKRNFQFFSQVLRYARRKTVLQPYKNRFWVQILIQNWNYQDKILILY